MTRIRIKSAEGAVRYALRHLRSQDMMRHPDCIEHYVAISIQDSTDGGFGFRLTETAHCHGVLTLFFDDIEEETEGLVLFDEAQAREIIRFIQAIPDGDALLIHCFAGISRSQAVGAFAKRVLNGDCQAWEDLRAVGCPNVYVYETLCNVWAAEAENE